MGLEKEEEEVIGGGGLDWGVEKEEDPKEDNILFGGEEGMMVIVGGGGEGGGAGGGESWTLGVWDLELRESLGASEGREKEEEELKQGGESGVSAGGVEKEEDPRALKLNPPGTRFEWGGEL